VGKLDYSQIHELYSQSLAEHGAYSEKALRWVSKENQLKRFQVFYEYLKNENMPTILDVGCGVGDLYGFLKEKKFACYYKGIDIVPEMVSAAKQKFPGGEFVVADIMTEDFSADFILASGIMCIKINQTQDHQEYVDKLIKRLFPLCHKALIFNMLDSLYFDDDEYFYPFVPFKIMEQLVHISTKTYIRHDYLNYDFTCYVGK